MVFEKVEKYANHIELLSYSLIIATSFIFYYLFLNFDEYFLNFNKEKIDNSAYFFLLILFFTSISSVQIHRLNRDEKFFLISLNGVLQKISTLVTQILLGFIGLGIYALVYGSLTGLILSVSYIFFSYTRKLKIFTKLSFENLVLVSKKYSNYPKFTVMQNFFNSLSNQSPIILIGYFYGIEYAGFYWMAMRVIQIPAVLFSDSVKKVFYTKASNVKEDLRRTFEVYNRFIYGLAVAILPVVVLFWLIGDDLIMYILGTKWFFSSEIAQWLIIWIGAGFISPPATAILLIHDKQKLGMYYDFSLLIARIIALSLGGIYLEAIQTISVLAIIGVVFNLSLVLYVRGSLSRKI